MNAYKNYMDRQTVSSGLHDKLMALGTAPVKRTIPWQKWGVIAACFVAVTILGAGLAQGGLFGSKTDIATLDNGDKIAFAKTKAVGTSSDIDIENLFTKQLTEEEIEALSPVLSALPVTAHATFRSSDLDGGGSRDLVGFEGYVGNVKMVISTSDVRLLDTVIVGTEKTTEINGITVSAGYFVTDRNSRGEQNVIYYGTFERGDCEVYLENGGKKEDSETIKNQLAEVIQKLTESGALDLASFRDETGMNLDGNPNGYDPLPNNGTSGEEVSEQDPAAN